MIKKCLHIAHLTAMLQRRCNKVGVLLAALLTSHLSLLTLLSACTPEPPLYLFDGGDIDIKFPMVSVELDSYWDYDSTYDWRKEWYYGWDDEDRRLFGEMGYVEPTVFALRRYYTGDIMNGPHQYVLANTVDGSSFSGKFQWGMWDILVWNDIHTLDGVQSLIFDESSLDRVTAYTNQTMHTARYHAPRYTYSFYQPEPLFAVYEQGVDINRELRGFEYDPERNLYVKKLNMTLEPVTFIYLTQVILHHNNNKIAGIDGSADLSGFARTTTLNTCTAGDDPITVYYNSRLKNNCDKLGETVDIIGGRLMTFGMCRLNVSSVKNWQDFADAEKHYLDVTMQVNNGMDSTFVFDVTNQVRRRYKGGVITVELDMDSIPVPSRSGGSAFDAIVKDFEDGGTHEFEM